MIKLTECCIMILILSCNLYSQEYIYKNCIRSAEDITINGSGFSINDNLNSIIITIYAIKYSLSFMILRREFEEFVGEYPNPWIENNIVFEIGDSALVTLAVLDSDLKIFDIIFEFNLTRGIYTVKPGYVFNLLPPGKYNYCLQFGNENVIKKLDIIAN